MSYRTSVTTPILPSYLLASAHMSLGLVRLIQGFIIYRDTIGPIEYFASVFIRVNMAKDYLYITNVSSPLRDVNVSDSLLAGRCSWAISSSSGACTLSGARATSAPRFPSSCVSLNSVRVHCDCLAFSIADVRSAHEVAGYGATSQWLLPHPNGWEMLRWGTAMFTISMVTNILVTAVIASRIW